MYTIIIEVHKNEVNIEMPGTQWIRGVWVTWMALISWDHSPGTTDTYRLTFTDWSTQDIPVYNGAEVDTSNFVDKTTNQSIAWIKTFSDIPVVPVGGIKISTNAGILFNATTNSIDFTIN